MIIKKPHTENNTFISVGAFLILLTMIAGAVLYVASFATLAEDNRERIQNLEKKRFDVDIRIFDRLNTINNKVNKIEGYLDAQKELKKNQR